MRKEVVGWYNTLREAWGLEEIEIVFEETGDLILSDFTIERWTEPDDGFIVAADKAGFHEMFPGEREEKKDGMYHGKRYGVLPSDERSIVVKAETPAGEPAGFLWAVRNDFRTDLATVHILQVYVFPEFRGLGLAKALFRFFHDMIGKMDIRRITIELMGESLHLNDSFRGEGFSPFSEVLELDLSFRGESGSD
jgi:GNAT superfamily N-acetyltransferase